MESVYGKIFAINPLNVLEKVIALLYSLSLFFFPSQDE